ncbi:hypothetical protein B0H14DRAFT_2596490 [Mycena olivaceomarginata]|nr:hypothetical protein B0H14DRAFT_2596490 [Mycena olivaceomarginata]
MTARIHRADAVNKLHRFHPSEAVLRQIHPYQKSTKLLIKKVPFQRLVREIPQNYKVKMVSKNELPVLNVAGGHPVPINGGACSPRAAEAYLVSLLEDANHVAAHGKRITVTHVIDRDRERTFVFCQAEKVCNIKG